MNVASLAVRRCRHVFVVVAIFSAFASAAAAPAIGKTPVTIAVDRADDALVKADAGALYRRPLDGGEWTRIVLPGRAARRGVTALAVSQRASRLVYVAIHGVGMLRSPDGGLTWDTATAPVSRADVTALAAHATQPDTVYAYVRSKGIFRSEDRGDHWRLMGAAPRDGLVQFVHSDMAGSMQSGWLFAATTKGVSRSMDCFCGWHDAGGLGRRLNAIAYDPHKPSRVYAASADGLLVSDDGGEHWSPVPSPGRIRALAATGDAILAADDRGNISRSRDQGMTWERIDG